MTQRIVIEHLARVEGHGGVTVELEDGGIGAVQFDIFEGARLLEALVRGRRYDEVAPIGSRICAICSAAHTLASLSATEHAFGIVPSARTLQLRDLLLRGENIESHALHVFLLALPDYLGAPSAIALAADRREVVELALRLKQLGNTIQETIGGRAIHPVTAVVGGFTSAPDTAALLRLRAALEQGTGDVRVALEVVAGLPTIDVGHSTTPYAALVTTDGYGYAAGTDIRIEANGKSATVPVPKYRTLADERTVPHSHAKHTRWAGESVMVGALARVAVNGARLPRVGVHAAVQLGLTAPFDDPLDNNLAQAVELAVDVEQALELVESLLADDRPPEPVPPVTPRAGTGTGAVEAPRGLLVHSYRYDADGRLVTADVVTPTALNAASVEHRLRAAAEQTPTDDIDALRHRLEMVVRAYDPCISCAVHVLDQRRAP
jgi:sulfhydrogenase subunit alpha